MKGFKEGIKKREINEYKLDGKFVVPMKLHTHTGQSKITGVFFVYEDEELAKKHVNSVIFQRLDKAKAKGAEPPKEDTKSDAEPPKEDTKSDAEKGESS